MVENRFAYLSDFVDVITRRDAAAARDSAAASGAPADRAVDSTDDSTHDATQDATHDWTDDATARALARPPLERITAACAALMGRIGDASRVAVAQQALTAYDELDEVGRLAFFALLRDEYGVDDDAIHRAYAAWSAQPSPTLAADLFEVVEPRRQELLRRLNLAPGATLRLVHMRADLLQVLRTEPTLACVDQDFAHLLSSWFNRGFLIMRHVDWTTSAAVLEKIKAYETVHPMAGWADLRRRLDPHDRRLYAFFHPATGQEPLIFVEVALIRETPEAIATILDAPVPTEPVAADTAVFYSINNTLPGLKGVSFGNFLIKQVVADLRAELPELSTFVTLSPAPGFAVWLAESQHEGDADLHARLAGGDWAGDPEAQAQLRPRVEAAAARYFVRARSGSGLPVDPVARFHLGNGASAWRVNWPADRSAGALRRAHGLMINYRYEPAQIEAHHEAYVRDGTIAHGPQLAVALNH